MVTKVPVDTGTIVWARKRSQLSVDRAASLLKCETSQLEKIEAGTAMPTATQFRRMADIYLLPEATLLGLVPASELALPKDFRSFEGARVDLSYETVLAVRRVQARQEAIAHLAEIDDQIVAPELPIHTIRDDPEQLGASFRREFGFPVIDQLTLTTQQSYQRWRRMIEDMGVSVYVEPLGKDDSRGVSMYFNEFPAIIIDQNEKQHGARLFTLFHELAHLLIRQTGISNFSPRNAVENFCNRFAASFLMPREAVQAVFDVADGKKIEPDLPQLEFAARKLSVTISQIALRLEHLEYAPKGLYARIAKLLRPPSPKPKGKGGPEWKYMYLSRYGHNLPSYVIGSLDRGQISSVEAARLMDAAPANIGVLRATLAERRLDVNDVFA
ncbi:ImmA/IrrE family metallo-endopeptidase [Mesorhizobium sp. M0118]|uniref:ImmA/IrrE family metallo-endopeptidase n=1 Tax=Mesorhizobium sp. M0118 TaxID=2956884 RepID=UPI0033381D52